MVQCSVTRFLNESEAGVDLALIQTSLRFYVNHVVMLTISMIYQVSTVEVKVTFLALLFFNSKVNFQPQGDRRFEL